MFAKTLVIAAAFAGVALAAKCPDSELGKLTALISNPNIAPCSSQSGFSLIPPTGLPTDDQLKKMCVSDACKNVITSVKALNPTDCDLTVGSVTLNVASLVNNFASDCARVGGTPAPAPGPAPTSAPGPAPTSAPTTAPSPGTPTVTTSAPAPGPAPTTAAPVDNSC